jgi:hypothetical protein
MAQCEVLEKERSGSVQERPPHALTAARYVYKSTLLQRLENRARTNAADVLDFESTDRLPVCDYRQRFERGARETLRARRKLRAFDCLRVFRPREYLPSVTHGDELDTVALVVVPLSDLVECRHNGCGWRLRIELI